MVLPTPLPLVPPPFLQWPQARWDDIGEDELVDPEVDADREDGSLWVRRAEGVENGDRGGAGGSL